MGKPGPVHKPYLSLVRGSPILVTASLTIILLALGGLAAHAESEVPDDKVWAEIVLSAGQSREVVAIGDTATFDLEVAWGGLVSGEIPLLRVDPVPEGWDFSVTNAVAGDGGFALPRDGQIELVLTLSDRTEPGNYYLEPRLDNPVDGTTLISIPLSVTVTPFLLGLDTQDLEDGPVVPGSRLEGELQVWADAPVDRQVEVHLDWAPEGWKVSLLKDQVVLREGITTSVTAKVEVAAWTLPGDYAVVFSSRSPDPRALGSTKLVVVTVEAVRALRFQSLPGDIVTHAGGTGSAEVVVENGGNVPETIITFASPLEEHLPVGWRISQEHLPVTVPPFGHAIVSVNVHIPADATLTHAGATTLPLRLLTGHEDTELTLTLQVQVPLVRALKIGPQGPGGVIETTLLRSAGYHEYSTNLAVTDAGNGQGVREVSLSGEFAVPVKHVSFSQGSLLMTPAMEVEVEVKVLVDLDATPGRYTAMVKVSDGAGGEATVELAMRVPNLDASFSQQITVDNVVDPSVYSRGSKTTLMVVQGTVVNDGDVDLAFAKVDLFDTSSQDAEHIGYIPIENLTVGEARTFGFTYDAEEPGEVVVEARLMVTDSAPSSVNTVRLEHDVEAVPVKVEGIAMPFAFVLGVAVGTLAGIIAIMGTEAGRFALMLFILVPLYTRLKPDQVKDQFTRGQILGYVKANPGETYSSIRKALRLSNGQFVYHARILESQDLIKSVKDGANRRFYPAGMRIPREVKDVKLNQVQRIIYTIILEYPGISQSRISKMVSLAPSTVNYHVNIMTKVGVIERRRSGRLSLCFAADEAD
jgi:predicted transcriptional regulator